MSVSAESVLTVTVEPLNRGFLRVALGWIVSAAAAAGLGWLSEPSAALRVRKRADNEIVYEQSFRGSFHGALLAQETLEADLARTSLQDFLAKYAISQSKFGGK